MKKQSYWLAAAGLAALAFTAIPAQAHTDVSIGVGLGGPYYYEEPYYAPPPRVVYEEPVYYEPERVYYGHRYCPPRQVYYRHGYRHWRHHERYWDGD